MPSHQKLTADVSAIGIDIGKNTFHLIDQDQRGKIVMRAWLSRSQLIARRLLELGHDVRLIPAQYVKPFLKGHKNDYRDAEAIIEAAQRPMMSFVAVKTAEQCDLQALHRVRSRLVRLWTGVINQIRGLLLERGVVIGQRTAPLRQALPVILVDPPKHVSSRILRLIGTLIEELNGLEDRIETLTQEIEALAVEDDACQRLMTIPAIG
jgi:transposase